MTSWNIGLSGEGSGLGTWAGAYTVLGDGSTATVVKKTSAAAGDSRTYPTQDIGIPANEVIDGIRWRCQMSRPSFQTNVGLALVGVGELSPRVGAGAATYAGYTDMTTVTGPWVTQNETAQYSNLTGRYTPGPLSQADLFNAAIRISDATVATPASTYAAAFAELSLDMLTASVPLVSVSAPSGTIVDNVAPPVVWTYTDTQSATITNKALTSGVVTLTTSAPHGFLVGNDVTVAIGDAVFDGTWKVSGVTSTTFTYARASTNVASTGASGTATIGDGIAQYFYEVRVYAQPTAGWGSFNPNTTSQTPVWEAGATGTASTVTPPALPNATTFRAYVRSTKLSTLGRAVTSAWAYSTFTTSATPPPDPLISATYDAPAGRVALVVQNGGNKLSADDASAETTVGSWSAVTNCGAPTRSSTLAFHGSWSVRMSSTAAGTMTMCTATGTSGAPVLPGQTYSVMAQIRSSAAARSCRVGVQFYDAAGATIGSVSYGAAVTSATGSWKALTNAVLAPPLAAFAAVFVEVQSTGGAAELHYVDAIGLAAGDPVPWSPGGRTYSVAITRTQGGRTTLVRGAAALVPGAGGTVSIYDYEATRDQLATYTATVTATAAAAAVTSSAGAATATPANDGTWWVKAVTKPSLNLGSVPVIGNPQVSHEENLGVFRIDGRSDAVVVSGQSFGDDPDYTILARGAAQIAAIRALVVHQGTLLVQEPWEDESGFGRQRYVRLTARSWTEEGTLSEPRTTFSVKGVEVGQGY